MRTSSNVAFASLCLECGTHSRWLTISEAERMRQRGQCKRYRVTGQKRRMYILTPAPEPSESKPSSLCITFEDMLANVGLGTPTQVMLARAKIGEFGKRRLWAATP